MLKCRSCGWESLDPNAVHNCEGLGIAKFTQAKIEQSTALAKQVGGKHYKKHTIQPWHIIDDYELCFYKGNAIKYILRDKENEIEDTEKAIHYLERKLELLKLAKEKEHTKSLFDDGTEDHD